MTEAKNRRDACNARHVTISDGSECRSGHRSARIDVTSLRHISAFIMDNKLSQTSVSVREVLAMKNAACLRTLWN